MGPLSPRRLLASALLLVAAFCGAAEVSVAPSVAVYPAPVAWTAALPQVAALSGVPGLDAGKPQMLAPLTYQLSHALGLSAEAFQKLPEHDRQTVVHMALDQAREDLTQKAYELVARSQKLVWTKEGVTKAELDALYPIAVQLREIDRNYSALLDPSNRGIVAQSAAQSATAWREARAAYVARFGEATKKGLRSGKEDAVDEAAVSAAADAPPRLPPFEPGATARALYEQMKRNRSGDYGQRDYAALLKGYGFDYRDTGPHRMYYLPEFPRLAMPVPRHNDLKPYLVDQALDLVEQRLALSAPAGLPALPASLASHDDELPPPPSAEKAVKPKPAKAPATIAVLPITLEPTDRGRPKTPVEKSPRRGDKTAAKPAVPAPAPPPPQEKAPAAKAKRFEEATFKDAEPMPAEQKLPVWERLRRTMRRLGF